jgi:hypothetical protein
MHFTVLQVVALSLAFLAQFSRIFAATKPFWGKLPAAVQVWLPPILPFAASLQAQLAGVVSWTDFTVALIVSAALLLPGAPSNRSTAPLKAAQPFKPPPLGVLMLTLCFAAGLLGGCSLFGSGGSVWPAVARCAPSVPSLVGQVAAILLAGGDYEAALLELAKKATKEAVICAAQTATDELSSGKLGTSSDRLAAAARGRAFLEKTGNAK